MSARYLFSVRFIFQSLIVLFVLLCLFFLGGFFIRREFSYSEIQLKGLLEQYFRRQGFILQLSEVEQSFLWRPTVLLKNVKIFKRTKGYSYYLAAKKLEISFSYSFFWKKINPYRLRMNSAQIRVNERDNLPLSSIASTKSYFLQNLVLPKYIEIKDSNLSLTKAQHTFHFEHLNLQLYSPKSNLSYVEASTTMAGLWNLSPTRFVLRGLLRVNSKNIQSEGLYLIGNLNMYPKLYQLNARFDFNWLLEQNFLALKKIHFSGIEASKQLSYQGNIEELLLKDFHQIFLPRVSIDFRQEQVKKLEGYLVLSELACQFPICTVENIRFGTNYQKGPAIFTASGTVSLGLDWSKNLILLDQLIAEGRFLSERGAIPLMLKLEDSSLLSLGNQMSVYLTGFLNRQPLKVVIKQRNKTLQNLESWEIWVYLLGLDWLGNQPNSNFSLEKYDIWLKKTLNYLNTLSNKQVMLNFSLGHFHFFNFPFFDFSGVLAYQYPYIYLRNLKGKLFEGEFQSEVELKLGQLPNYKIDARLENFKLESVLASVSNLPFLSGQGTAYGSLKTEGKNIVELLDHLAGVSILEVQQGYLEGLGLDQLLHKYSKVFFSSTLQEQLKFLQLLTPSISKAAKTWFDHLKLASYWSNGIGETIALEFQGPQFQVEGTGTADLKQRLIDYSLVLSGSATRGEKKFNFTIPVRMAGPLSGPDVYLDYKKMVGWVERAENKEKMLKRFIKQQWNLLRYFEGGIDSNTDGAEAQ
ncbi:MAG: AsmA-like C-terminal region-containing protein [Neisseriaceae bacterium]